MGLSNSYGHYVIKPGLFSVGRIGAAVLLLACQSAKAGGEMLSEIDWIADVPKVVFATRQEQEVTSAPSSVTIITRDMIRAQGALNIAEILRLVPGFQVFASNGSTFGVTAHGYSDRDPRRLEVRVNGRSVYLPQLSSVAWESLGVLPDDIDHIEVVRGSNVPAFGSNAILGAINIITRNPVQDSGGAVSTTAGSAGTQIVSARQNLSADMFDFQIRTAYKESDGFDAVEDEAHVGHMVVNLVYTPNFENTIELESGFSRGAFGIGDGDHLNEFAEDHRRAAWINTDLQHTSGDHLFKLRASYADYTFKHSLPFLLSDLIGVTPETIPLFPLWPEPHVDELLETSGGKRDFSVFNVELEHHFSHNQWRSVWGLGTRLDTVKSGAYLSGKVDSAVNYLFANIEWKPIAALAFNAGFMMEDREGFDVDVSPRLALNYHLDNNHHLRFSATRAYRQPALLESDRLWTVRFRNGDLVDLVQISDPNIDSEQLESLEAGYFLYALDGRLGLDVKIFQEQMEDAIDGFDIYRSECANPSPAALPFAQKYCQDFYIDGQNGAVLDPKVRVYSNTASWEVKGLEAQLSWELNERSWVRINYAYLDAYGIRDRRLIEPLTTEGRDSVPKKSGGILFSYEFTPDWSLGSHLFYTDDIDWRAGTNVSSHARLDLTLAKSWNVNGTEAELKFIAQNVGKGTYLEFQQNNEFGRRGFVTFTLKWN